MFESPQAEHEWLMQLMGEWTFSHQCNAGPDVPETKSEGRVVSRSLGGMWILLDCEGGMPGVEGKWTSQICLGYNPKTGKYTGTFVGSMMTHLWVYEGELNAEKTILTLSVEGPRMDGQPGLTLYHDIYEIVDPDHWILRSEIQDDNGEWVQFMEGHHYRVK